ncbi:hypothetical protein HDU93_009275 [Gonapodya sp. JEL0774]|nr:hypothetical protein HDU93_009275 [Gonapodya sp. JEL0774]
MKSFANEIRESEKLARLSRGQLANSVMKGEVSLAGHKSHQSSNFSTNSEFKSAAMLVSLSHSVSSLFAPALARAALPALASSASNVAISRTHSAPATRQVTRRAYNSASLSETIEDLLIADHRNFADLMRRYNLTNEKAEKKAALAELIRQVAVHSVGEEKILYPILEKIAIKGDAKAVIARERLEHKQVRDMLYDLLDRNLAVGESDFEKDVEGMYKYLAAHCAGEEVSDCAEMARFFPESARREFGSRFTAVKKLAEEQVAEEILDMESKINVSTRVDATMDH